MDVKGASAAAFGNVAASLIRNNGVLGDGSGRGQTKGIGAKLTVESEASCQILGCNKVEKREERKESGNGCGGGQAEKYNAEERACFRERGSTGQSRGPRALLFRHRYAPCSNLLEEKKKGPFAHRHNGNWPYLSGSHMAGRGGSIFKTCKGVRKWVDVEHAKPRENCTRQPGLA